jgi:hypothetical protein
MTPERAQHLLDKARSGQSLTDEEIEEVREVWRAIGELAEQFAAVMVPGIGAIVVAFGAEANRVMEELAATFGLDSPVQIAGPIGGGVTPLGIDSDPTGVVRVGEGCWADEWYEGPDVYDLCNADPDPASDTGLCTKHLGMLASRQGRLAAEVSPTYTRVQFGPGPARFQQLDAHGTPVGEAIEVANAQLVQRQVERGA